MNPPRPRTVPPWDLPTVLKALKGPPFEPQTFEPPRLFLGMVQRGVSISEICEVAGWASPSTFVRFTTWMSLPYRPESFLLKLAILWVHLTNMDQAPPSLGLSILSGCQVSTYRTTPRPRMTLWLSLCLVYSLDSPRSYSHVSLGVESFHVIARHSVVLVPIQAYSTQYKWNIERERTQLLS